MTILPRLFALFLVLSGWLLAGTDPARAETSCYITATSLDFGMVDTTLGQPVVTTGAVTASCSGDAGATVDVCVDLGAGIGGMASDGSTRYLLNNSNKLAFDIYRDAARTSRWASSYGSAGTGDPIEMSVPLDANGSGSSTTVFWAAVAAGQGNALSGRYSSMFFGADLLARFTAGGTGGCSGTEAVGSTAGFMRVDATVAPRCTVNATALDFGSVGMLSRNIDSTNALYVSCTSGTFYAILLDNGQSGATDPARRSMSSGINRVSYGLYTNSARTVPWGDGNRGSVQAGIGTGTTQQFTVYGRVPPQKSPAPGTYSDTIVVTVMY